jgi:hypothetical protein
LTARLQLCEQAMFRHQFANVEVIEKALLYRGIKHLNVPPARVAFRKDSHIKIRRFKNIFRKTIDAVLKLVVGSRPQMKTCMNISTPARQMSVAPATRHDRWPQGCVFSLGLSIHSKNEVGIYSDRPEVGT